MNVLAQASNHRPTPARPIRSCGSARREHAQVTPTDGAGGDKAVRDHGFPPVAADSSPQTRAGRCDRMTVLKPRLSFHSHAERPSVTVPVPPRRRPDERTRLGPQLPRAPPASPTRSSSSPSMLRVDVPPVRFRRDATQVGRLPHRLLLDLRDHRRWPGSSPSPPTTHAIPRVVGIGVTEYKRVVNASAITFGLLAIVFLVAKVDIARGYFVLALPRRSARRAHSAGGCGGSG